MHSSRQQRYRQVANDIIDTLIGIAPVPRLMPGAASIPKSPAGRNKHRGSTATAAATPSSPAATDAAVARTIRSSASTPSLRSRDGAMARMDRGGNVRVVVRVRAFLPRGPETDGREMEKRTPCLIRMDPITQETKLLAPASADDSAAADRSATAGWAKAASRRAALEDRSFTFDKSFWSHRTDDAHYATQEDVYNSLGEEFLDHNFEGYHTCIFAYGQTGSGKSYTMMGTPSQPGLIPRTCEDLFERIEAAHSETPNIAYNVRVSYFEVYNEHVRDLLVPVVPSQPPYYLKIRESPTEGPYVKDLTEVPVRSLDEILRYMQMGDASRTTAATKMNDTSSRSHAVFTILLRQIHHDMETDETTERSSRIRLVDLAGSERAKATEATGQRLREGSNINKSLTTLGRVIAALAAPAPSSGKGKKKRLPGGSSGSSSGPAEIVPYRDSILTWLLKDSLGGNSKTAMIACIAPGDYDETLSTLRYADQAKRIRTRAVVNQDSISTAERDAQISSMAEEIRQLQLSVSDFSRRREKDALQQEERLEEYQNRVAAMQRMTEEKTLVAEGKIRSLQTENEALRLHLKLALESLKNPIPAVAAPRRRSSLGLDGSLATSSRRRRSRLSLLPDDVVPEEQDDENHRQSRAVKDDTVLDGDTENASQRGHPTAGKDADEQQQQQNLTDGENDMSDSNTLYEEDDDDDDMEEYMQSLLSDLGMFRRKIGDDKQRFIGGNTGGMGDVFGGARRPLTPRVNV